MAANGTVQIAAREFLGINQSRGERLDMRYATWAENMDTRFNKLRTAKGFSQYSPDLNSPIVTLARFYRRFEADAEARNVLVAATDTEVYVLVEGVDDAWTSVYTGATTGIWDYVIYEDYRDGEVTPVDVLLMSNAYDGMIAIWGDTLEAVPVETPAKFGAIARYKERIFGTAAIADPDRIWYSAPFNPKDWAQNVELPQDGGGLIDYPTWDGDSFIALRPFGSYLLAFKRQTVCILTGADPGEYTIYEGYGTDGPIAENTIVTNQNTTLFLTRNGIGMYDGATLRMIDRDAIADIADEINYSAIETSTAAFYEGIYCCAVPMGSSEYPNAVIEYDTERGTFMLRTGFGVGAWLKGEGNLLLTTQANPYRACLWGSADTYDGQPINAVWVSPWTDTDYKESTKSAFRLRSLIEGTGDMVTFSIQTERKTKSKLLTTQPKDSTKKKMLSKAVSNKGRQFRWSLQSSGVPFAIHTGIQIEVELDSD